MEKRTRPVRCRLYAGIVELGVTKLPARQKSMTKLKSLGHLLDWSIVGFSMKVVLVCQKRVVVGVVRECIVLFIFSRSSYSELKKFSKFQNNAVATNKVYVYHFFSMNACLCRIILCGRTDTGSQGYTVAVFHHQIIHLHIGGAHLVFQ